MSRRGGKADRALLRDPEELLNQFLLVQDENIVLKKHNNEQEDKIKKLATKLVRITADLKRRYDEENAGGAKGPRVRDYRAEERIAELQQENRELGRKCEQLRKKNEYLQQLVPNQKGQRRTGGPRRRPPSRQPSAARSRPAAPPPLEVAEIEPEFEVEEEGELITINNRPSREGPSEQDIAQLQNELTKAQAACEAVMEQNARLQQQVAASAISGKKIVSPPASPTPGGPVATIRPQMYSDEDYQALQREMRDKMTALTKEKTKVDKLTIQFEALAANEQRLIQEVEARTVELKSERAKHLESSRDAALAQMLQGQLNEIKKSLAAEQEMREDVEVENSKLTRRIFQVGDEGKGELSRIADELNQEKKNRACFQIYQLFEKDQQVRGHLGMMNILRAGLEKRIANSGSKTSEIEAEVAKLKQELAMFKSDAGADDEQMKEMRRIMGGGDGGQGSASALAERDRAQQELKTQLQEIARVKQLLDVQKTLGTEWKAEKDMLTEAKKKAELDLQAYHGKRSNADDASKEAHQAALTKLQKENAKLLQDLALEKAKPRTEAVPTGQPQVAVLPQAEVIDLSAYEAGDNVLEVSVMHAALSQLAVEDLGYTATLLQSFVLVDFASHTPATTRLASGVSPRFDLDIEYTVEVDAFFLELLLEEPVVVELYIRGGAVISQDATAQTPFATGTLALADLLRHPDQRVLQRVDLMTVPTAGIVARCIGSIQLSAGMKSSIAAVAHRFMERSSNALNATLQQAVSRTTAASSADPRATISVNVISCTGLRVDRSGPPSPCVAYQFFNFPPTDTCVELSTPNPQFDDLRFFEVINDNHIKNYLKSCELDFTVFDDSGPMPDTIVGSALVRLEPLLRNVSLQGQFEVMSQGKSVGYISLEISWQHRGLDPASQ